MGLKCKISLRHKVEQNLEKGGSHSNTMTLYVRGPNHHILMSQIDHQRVAWISANDKANKAVSESAYFLLEAVPQDLSPVI